MIRLFQSCEPSPTEVSDPPDGWTVPDATVWIDLVEPSRTEELAIERILGRPVPTPDEMAEIEASSRLYRQDQATYLTTDLLYNTDALLPLVGPVTFILSEGPLVTVRYFEPRAFKILGERFDRDPELCSGAVMVLMHLFEAIIDRTADVIERLSREVDDVSNDIFVDPGKTNYARAIKRLGVAQHASSRISDSLTGIERALTFIQLDSRFDLHPEAGEHHRSLSRDIQSLQGHIGGLVQTISFQLSAALGLINIEQSAIIKIFSVAAVAFMPPTLIASIYGMNFHHMPELSQIWGYPAALLAMVVSALFPLWYFKKRRWL
ncbi:magnesium transporter CorA family protein [Brevundimonas aveniformis]|uniref:magnesium transporter CorA family protein n=1 Tax=Brevundimonas aveniformis TaxID=370977 RepID=UPI002492E176|nr:magnesium transporter CorA family protein [Brevundimonas aveniformis]